MQARICAAILGRESLAVVEPGVGTAGEAVFERVRSAIRARRIASAGAFGPA
jgi:hypothetical protein